MAVFGSANVAVKSLSVNQGMCQIYSGPDVKSSLNLEPDWSHLEWPACCHNLIHLWKVTATSGNFSCQLCLFRVDGVRVNVTCIHVTFSQSGGPKGCHSYLIGHFGKIRWEKRWRLRGANLGQFKHFYQYTVGSKSVFWCG